MKSGQNVSLLYLLQDGVAFPSVSAVEPNHCLIMGQTILKIVKKKSGKITESNTAELNSPHVCWVAPGEAHTTRTSLLKSTLCGAALNIIIRN